MFVRLFGNGVAEGGGGSDYLEGGSTDDRLYGGDGNDSDEVSITPGQGW